VTQKLFGGLRGWRGKEGGGDEGGRGGEGFLSSGFRIGYLIAAIFFLRFFFV
jgi:hypothetical protein